MVQNRVPKSIFSDVFFFVKTLFLLILGFVLGRVLGAPGCYFSLKLRSEDVDFVLQFAIFGGPRPLHVGSQRRSESRSIYRAMFKAFRAPFGVLNGSRNRA